MCGRFTRRYTWRQVHDFLDLRFPAGLRLSDEVDGLAASYNVAPTQTSSVITGSLAEGGRLEGLARVARWGVSPRGWSGAGNRDVINAKAETVAAKPLFQRHFRDRRCVVPVSSFFEWQRLRNGKKQPWCILRADGAVLLAAGLWSPRRGNPGGPTGSFAIITTAANPFMARLHDRMPAILEPQQASAWCDPRTPADAAESMLRPAAAGEEGAPSPVFGQDLEAKPQRATFGAAQEVSPLPHEPIEV